MNTQKLAEIMSASENMLIKARAAHTKIHSLQEEISNIIGEFNQVSNVQTWKLSINEQPNINDLILTTGQDKRGQYDFNMYVYNGDSSKLLTKWIKLPGLED